MNYEDRVGKISEEAFGKILDQFLNFISMMDSFLLELVVKGAQEKQIQGVEAITGLYAMGNRYLIDKGLVDEKQFDINHMANFKLIAKVEMLDYCLMCSFIDGRLSGSRVRMINAILNTHMNSIEMREYLKASWEAIWSECPVTFEMLLILDGSVLGEGSSRSFWESYYRCLIHLYTCIDEAGEGIWTEQNSNVSVIRDYLAMLINRVKEVGLPIPADLEPYFD